MKMIKKLVLLIICAQIFFVPTANAYEGPLHYAWTYYLALQVGFTERQAYQIASGTNAIDWDPDTNPVASPLDTKIDTLFGADRFRYFDQVMNNLWFDLNDKFQNSDLRRRDKGTTLLKLRKVLRGNSPETMLDGTWRKYYNAMVKRNPAIRTWVQLHAFQPIVLQRHPKKTQKDEIEFSRLEFNTVEADAILLDYPLTSISHATREWKDDWWKYLLLTNENLMWAFGKALEKPTLKNGLSSKLDADTFELFIDTTGFCGSSSIKDCLINQCEKLKAQAKSIVDTKNDRFTCSDKIPIMPINNLNTKISELITPILAMTPKNTNVDDPLPDEGKLVLKLNEFVESNRIFIDLINKINKYQKETLMAWPLIYSAFMRDIESYILDEYWKPHTPDTLETIHIPTKAVNIVRGKVTNQLVKLAKQEHNPGPLLHYVQDLHSHGPYNTYNGHALTNHAPDFINQNKNNAENATIDTLIILCEFKKFLGNISPKKAKYGKLFVGHKTVKSEFCRAVEEDKSDSSKLKELIAGSLSDDRPKGWTLKDILMGAGEKSVVPKMESSQLTTQFIVKVAGNPPHFIDEGKVAYKSNEALGLPDFPSSVRFLGEFVKSDVIPVWRKSNLRVEDLVITDDPKNMKLPKNKDNISANIRDKWKPSKIPTDVIQYDYDYCGRVVYRDINYPVEKDLKKDPDKLRNAIQSSVPCNQKIDGSKKSEIGKPTNTLYRVENILVDVKNIAIKINKKGTRLATKMEYNISGVIPGLDGGLDISITKPKNIFYKFKKEGEKDRYTGKSASTDMFTTESQINHGPDHLPVFELCQMLVAHSEDIKKELYSITMGTFTKKDEMTAEDSVYNYIFGEFDESDLTKWPILYRGLPYKSKSIETDNITSIGYQDLNKTVIKKYLENNSTFYTACSVQVQGLPPVVALKKASRGFKLKVKGVKKGKSLK